MTDSGEGSQKRALSPNRPWSTSPTPNETSQADGPPDRHDPAHLSSLSTPASQSSGSQETVPRQQSSSRSFASAKTSPAFSTTSRLALEPPGESSGSSRFLNPRTSVGKVRALSEGERGGRTSRHAIPHHYSSRMQRPQTFGGGGIGGQSHLPPDDLSVYDRRLSLPSPYGTSVSTASASGLPFTSSPPALPSGSSADYWNYRQRGSLSSSEKSSPYYASAFVGRSSDASSYAATARLDPGSEPPSPVTGSSNQPEVGDMLSRPLSLHKGKGGRLSTAPVVGDAPRDRVAVGNEGQALIALSPSAPDSDAPPPLLHQESNTRQMTGEDSYEMIIRQHPEHGRVCSFGSKDRRTLNPLPIVQVKVKSTDGSLDDADLNLLAPQLVMQTSLRDSVVNVGIDLAIPVASTADGPVRVLEGKLTSSACLARDLDEQRSLFFVFPDLSVRVEGVFRLHFSLIKLGTVEWSTGVLAAPAGRLVASITSKPFLCQHSRRFPAVKQSSALALARHLAAQAVPIPLRNELRETGPGEEGDLAAFEDADTE